jgi:hypothetical protein
MKEGVMRIHAPAAAALAASALALQGCYVVPQGTNGLPPGWYIPYDNPAAAGRTGAPPPTLSQPAAPAALSARLYPANDQATQVGMVSGTVTNMMNGKGRFQLEYRGELLAGEATRVSGDERKGVASAYGPSGTYMSCEYQMSSPLRGAGMCNFSDGARYQVHIGN